MERVKLTEKFSGFSENWVPKVVGELNGQFVKVVKFVGEYVWHSHDHEDEMFLVFDGHIDIHFRDRVVGLDPGEFCIVPRGVEHKPVAERQASVILFEPATTRNTGSVDHNYTIEPHNLERI
ncbi:MAG: cupin domain-containing protein [Phycisphaerales bacterium]|nr:cupin domain-containing protein [Phycisphaerales bacterium]